MVAAPEEETATHEGHSQPATHLKQVDGSDVSPMETDGGAQVADEDPLLLRLPVRPLSPGEALCNVA